MNFSLVLQNQALAYETHKLLQTLQCLRGVIPMTPLRHSVFVIMNLHTVFCSFKNELLSLLFALIFYEEPVLNFVTILEHSEVSTKVTLAQRFWPKHACLGF